MASKLSILSSPFRVSRRLVTGILLNMLIGQESWTPRVIY